MSKFPSDVIAAAQKSQRATGCPTCITLAQWALESGWGKSVSGTHNYFGIKWTKACPFPYTMCQTTEYINGKTVHVEAPFVNFPDVATAFDYHAKLLMNPHGPYNKAIRFAKSWRTFLHILAPIYATDRSYEHKITQIIVDNNLEHFNAT